jgi:hypothetical protein
MQTSQPYRCITAALLTAGVVSVLAVRAAPAPQARGSSITVRAGEDLQAALNDARPGDTILLQAGATFVGNFVLPIKGGAQVITVRTASTDRRLPGSGARITPAHASLLPKLRSPNALPALRTEAGAHHWRLELLEFQSNATPDTDIIRLGDGSRAQNTLAMVPHNLAVDRCYIHGDPERGQLRGIALNSAATSITGSHIAGIKAAGRDSQAIAGWNGPGPFLIENNYLEAAAENVAFGGSDPAIRDLVPSDIVIRRNHLAKPIEWRGSRWTVKNLFQLKNARRVLVEGNLMEYNWLHAQTGFAVLFTPRNQDGRSPWSLVEDVTFRYNIVRHTSSGINILGRDNLQPSGPSQRIRIAHNLFYDVDRRSWGGHGFFLQIGDGARDIIVENNTVLHSGTVIAAYGGSRTAPEPIPGFVFRHNLARHNTYGVHGAARAPGNDSLQAYFPGVVFRRNVLAGGRADRYPADNFFPSEDEFLRQFVDPDRADFRLVPASPFRRAGAEGEALGASIDLIERARRARVDASEPPGDRDLPLPRLPVLRSPS